MLTIILIFIIIQKATGPKLGKVDPNNEPHSGGKTFRGGTGGADTPGKVSFNLVNVQGLGGKGGPFRVDTGAPVSQISEVEKKEVSEKILSEAREMAQVKILLVVVTKIESSEAKTTRNRNE